MKVKTVRVVCIISSIAVLVAMAIISLVPMVVGRNDAKNSVGFYETRSDGDYDDDCFDFAGYLGSIGAKDIELGYTREDDVRRVAYTFKLDGKDYEIASGMYPVQLADDDYAGQSGAYGLMSTVEISDGETKYVLNPVGCNTVGIVADTGSSFYLLRDVFDVFHVITCSEADFYYGTEGDCPFRNLGIPHFTMKWNGDGWEFAEYCSDAGECRYDLHF